MSEYPGVEMDNERDVMAERAENMDAMKGELDTAAIASDYPPSILNPEVEEHLLLEHRRLDVTERTFALQVAESHTQEGENITEVIARAGEVLKFLQGTDVPEDQDVD